MIYYFDNYDSLPLERYKELLPKERAERFERFRQQRDKENCLAAYLLLKYALKQYGIKRFEIDKDENGKPFLKNENIHFNISHCQLGLAVAVSTDEVGIDIQDIEPYRLKLAKRVCAQEELKFIENSSNRDRTFTRLWTLKEAAAKESGDGIKVLDDFSFEYCENSFKKYGKIFTTFEKENLFISVCGSKNFSDIIEIKDLEVF